MTDGSNAGTLEGFRYIESQRLPPPLNLDPLAANWVRVQPPPALTPRPYTEEEDPDDQNT